MSEDLNYKSKIVESALEEDAVHDKWKKDYLCSENDKFYELAFDYIARRLNAEKGATVLDAGCGSCVHAIRLAERHFRVQGVDVSKSVISEAIRNVKERALEGKITVQKGNLLSLPFEDESFSYILCWGVLMHIPDVVTALNEIARVQKRGGLLVISENNMKSLESRLRPFRGALRSPVKVAKIILLVLLGRQKGNGEKTKTGVERWSKQGTRTVLHREADIDWLVKKLRESGYAIRHRIAGQFTESYVRRKSVILRRMIHTFNACWFKYVKWPCFAKCNLLVCQKM